MQIKELEYKSLCGLVDALGNNQLELSDVDGFHFSFRINQISKEFDLLKVKGDERVLNIELKSEMIEEDRIKKQLEQNQYYLKHIAKKIDSFTYVDGINQFFKLDEGELVKCCVSDLIQVLKDFKNYDDQIEQLFQVKNYLISPLNTPLAMSKTPHIQYLCGFARHGNLFYHSQNLWFCIYSNNQLQMV